MPLRTILAALIVLLLSKAHSQGLTCAESDPFCTGTIYEFPAGITGDAEPGPYYACLASQPAPAWYHMKIGNPGSITIYMYSTPLKDIDFCCWGPFTDPFSPCTAGLTASKVVDCSYLPDPQEWCDIPNGQTGEYYILLITNYSRVNCNITFSQTAGTGSTDCSILPPLVSSDSPLCVGDTLHLMAETISNATYSWTGPSGFSSSMQNPVIPDITLTQAGDYSCVITVYSQTSPPAITTVIVNDLPDAFLMSSDTTICPGNEAYMLVNLIGAEPFDVQYYDGVNYITVSGLSAPLDTIFVNPPGPATYTLLQVTDTACSKSLSGITFNVNNYPAVTGGLTGGDVICPGDTAELFFNLTGSPPWMITYLTNGMNPQTIQADYSPFILEVYPLVTTQYQFTGLYDAYCTGTASGVVEIAVDNPTGTLSGDNEICAGAGSQLIFNLTGYAPWTIKYTENGGNEQTITATYSPFMVSVNPLVNTLYEFTQLADAYCDGTVSGQAMITIHQPTGELSGNETVCAGESGTITFNLTGNPPWQITFTENGGNPQMVTAYSTPYEITLSPSVTTNYLFTEFEDSDCPGIPSGSALITVNPLPSVNAGIDQTIPNGTSTSLQASVSGGSGSYTYQWEPADKLVNPVVLQPQTVNLNSSTLFTLTVTDNNGGCLDSDDILVTIAGGPLSSYALADPPIICLGATSQLQVIASGGSGDYDYLWSSVPSGFSSDLQNPVVNPSESTTYFVTVNDGYNIHQANTSVNVNLLPVPNAGADQVIVYGTFATLNGSASLGSGNYNYHWEPAYLLDNPGIAQPTTVQLYETTLFILTVTDAVTGCEGTQSDVMAVMINGSALTAAPYAAPATICNGDSAQLFALANGGTGVFNYSWTSDPPGFVSDIADPLVNPNINTIYYLNVTDGFNFTSASVGVTVNQNPAVNLGSDTVVCVFDTITIDAGGQGVSYIWSNGSTERTVSVGSTGIGFESRQLSVAVTSAEGCVTVAQRNVAFDFAA